MFLRRRRDRQNNKTKPMRHRHPSLFLEGLESRTVLNADSGSFVRTLYVDYLGRLPSQPESDGWLRILDSGNTREQVLRSFTNSVEFRQHRLDQYYGWLLGRQPTSVKSSSFTHFDAATWDEYEVMSSLLASDEYFTRQRGTPESWLTGLYKDVLARIPDSQGYDYWLSRLDAGISRFDVATGFVASAEAQQLRGSAREGSLLRPVVFVDQAMLAAYSAAGTEGDRGPGSDAPVLRLETAGQAYTLLTNINATGTGISIAAANVNLNLNGYTVTYGGRTIAPVANGGFELPCSSTVPNWTLAGPASVSCRQARVGMWGNQMLHLELRQGETQTLTSDAITIPLTGREYAATVTPKGSNYRSCNDDYTQCNGLLIEVKVVDADNPATVLTSRGAENPSAGPEQGFSAVATFTPPAGVSRVKLVIEVRYTFAGTAWVDLDYAAVFPSRDFGVMATPIPDRDLPAQLRGFTRSPSNATIRNGFVSQNQGRAYKGNPLFFHALSRLTVDGVNARATGMDTNVLHGDYASSNVVVTNSSFDAAIDNISNRRRVYSAIHFNFASGELTIAGNAVYNYPHAGITVYRHGAHTNPILISGNYVQQNAIVADGYGITVALSSNFDVSYNDIRPIKGRGILLEGGFEFGDVARNGSVYSNYASAYEEPMLEYEGRYLEATALRLRNLDRSQLRDISIFDNEFTATTTSGGVNIAIGTRITLGNDATGYMDNSNIVLTSNTLRAIINGPSRPDNQAWAGSISGTGPGTWATLSSNILESNDVSLHLGDKDARVQDGATNEDVYFTHNVLRKSVAGAPPRAHRSIVVGQDGYQTLVRNIQIYSPSYEGGALPAVHFEGTGSIREVYMGWTLTYRTQRTDGTPISNALCRAFDRFSSLYEGRTDATGTGILQVVAEYHQPGQVTSFNPFDIEAWVGQQVQRPSPPSQNITSDRTFTLVFT